MGVKRRRHHSACIGEDIATHQQTGGAAHPAPGQLIAQGLLIAAERAADLPLDQLAAHLADLERGGGFAVVQGGIGWHRRRGAKAQLSRAAISRLFRILVAVILGLLRKAVSVVVTLSLGTLWLVDPLPAASVTNSRPTPAILKKRCT